MIKINPEDETTWLYYSDHATREKIDVSLKNLAAFESQKGIDSTEEEKIKLNKKMAICLAEITLVSKSVFKA